MRYEYIYISGKITGDPDYEWKFQKAAETLVEAGWSYWYIVNPARESCRLWPWWRCMVHDLRLLWKCGYVAMLPDWNESRGARIEHWVARLLKKEIIYLPTNKQ